MTRIPSKPQGLSRSLGAADPRTRRLGETTGYSKLFKLDGNGEITINIAPPLYVKNGQLVLNVEQLVGGIDFESETDIGTGLVLSDGKIKVLPGAGVDNLDPTGATLLDAIDKLNELLNSLRNANFIG